MSSPSLLTSVCGFLKFQAYYSGFHNIKVSVCLFSLGTGLLVVFGVLF